jgi:hypothetical protein
VAGEDGEDGTVVLSLQCGTALAPSVESGVANGCESSSFLP